MKSKKILVLIIMVIMLISIFTSCARKPAFMGENVESSTAAMTEELYKDEDEGSYKNSPEEEAQTLPDSASVGEVVKVSSKDRKIIYNASIHIETQKFDDSFAKVKEIIESNDGFLANSVLNSDGRYRTDAGDYIAEKVYSVTIRVPADYYVSMLDEIKKVGAVIDLTEDTVDKTSEYTDLDLRKKTLQVESDRLLDLLSKAVIIEDIIVLERRLTEIRHEMESMEQKIRTIDDAVIFSTITLLLIEIRDDVYVAPLQSTLGERMKEGFSKTLRSIKYGFENFLVSFITNIPYILMFLVILVIAVLIFKKAYKKVNTKTGEISKIVTKGPEKTKDEGTEKTLENKENKEVKK